MPVITLVLMSRPRDVQADPIPGSPDGLLVVRKLRDDPRASSVVAQIPARTLRTLRTRVSQMGRGGVRLRGGKLPPAIWRAVQELGEVP